MRPTTAILVILLLGSSSSSPRYLKAVLALSSFYSTNGCVGGSTKIPTFYSGSKSDNDVGAATSFPSFSSSSLLLSARHNAIPENSRRRSRKFFPTMAAAVVSSSETSSRNRDGDTSRSSPYLAIVTEPDSCDDEIRMEETFRAVQQAVRNDSSIDNGGNDEKGNGGIDLISIRVSNPNGDGDDDDGSFQKRVVELTKKIASLRNEQNKFHIVVNDNVQAAIDADADGIHVKEKNAHDIPSIRRRIIQHRREHFKGRSPSSSSEENRVVLIGTSSHAVSTAQSTVRNFQPDYLFVGTCYPTQTHPEKAVEDLEGPELPGMVKEALDRDLEEGEDTNRRPPIVYAIGGIDEYNCREPVRRHGADGVAVIRSVMQAEDPGGVVRDMRDRMMAE